jgi:sec-independent protein translocase protein TatA
VAAMPCGLHTGEVLMLALVITIIFSASRMGQLGNALGKFVYSFKKASKGDGYVEGKVTQKMSADASKVVDAEIVKEEKKS